MTRLVVVDLDGTLIPGNSFHLWMRYLSGWALRRGRLVVLVGVCGAAALRLLGLTSHEGLKRAVLRHSAAVPASDVAVFATRLATTIRPEVRAAVAAHAHEGLRVALVTAAPDLYLTHVAAAVGADCVVGTPSIVGDAWRETTGERKWTALTDRYGPDLDIDLVYTDHRDDLPLVRRARRAVIVDPTDVDWAVFVGCGTAVTRLA